MSVLVLTPVEDEGASLLSPHFASKVLFAEKWNTMKQLIDESEEGE